MLIVGAGLSGIGAACHLQAECPGKTYAILESRDAIGGTWDLFRYPGIRSDSDMLTLGYAFRPVAREPDARRRPEHPRVRARHGPRARRHRPDPLPSHGHRAGVVDRQRALDRQLRARRRRRGRSRRTSCSCARATTATTRATRRSSPAATTSRAGSSTRSTGRRTSTTRARRSSSSARGATAVTLVPAMADETEHITMLQRSPTYIAALPAVDPLAALLSKFLPVKVRYPLLRWKNILMMMGSYQLSRHRPQLMKAVLRHGRQAAAAGELRPRPPLQAQVRPVGRAPVRGSRRRPVQVRSGAARRRWSPNRSSASTRRASP